MTATRNDQKSLNKTLAQKGPSTHDKTNAPVLLPDVEVGFVIYECRLRKPDEWTLDAKRLVSFLTRPWDDGSY